jgi:hypothetical protein
MKNITKNLIYAFVLVLVGSLSLGGNFALAAVSTRSVSFKPSPIPHPSPIITTPVHFTIGAAPSVLTVPPTSTTDSITLEGVFLSNGSQTTTMFEYSNNQSDLPSYAPGTGQIVCSTTQAASAVSGPFSCTLNVPTITVGTKYYVRAIASNSNGTSYGNTTVIKTIAAPAPSVLTGVPSATLTSVTFNGTFISNGAQTTTMFEYSTNQSDLPSGLPGTGHIVCSLTQAASAVSGPFSCTLNVPTIIVGTTYYVRAIASNANGTAYGSVTSIQTNSSSSCSTSPTISSISPNSVYEGTGALNIVITGSNFINGTSVAEFNGSARTTTYSSPTSLTMTLTAADVAFSGTENITVSNGSGCTSGSVNFTVNYYSSGGGGGGGGGGGYSYYDPSVTTENASNISNNSATLNGLINPDENTTTAWFEYGTSSNLATFNSTNPVSEGSTSTSSALSQSISGLTPYTTYYFRAAANNAFGTIRGNILSFYTGNSVSNASELVTTIQAINKTSTTARLGGIYLNQDGIAAQGYFEYGTSASLGSTTSAVNLGTTSSLNFSDTATNLIPGTIYYFRAVALKQGVAYDGKILVFKTPSTGVVNSNNSDENLNDNPPVETGPAIVSQNQNSVIQITDSNQNVSVNDEINYLVTFKNNTSKNFENDKITVQLPKQVDFENSNFGKAGNDNTVVFDVGVLIPAQVGSMTITGKVNSNASAEDVLVTTAIMSYNNANSTLEKDEVAYVTNNVQAGANGLTANSIFGASFWPSNLLEWLILILIILGLVLISRKAYKNYTLKKAQTDMNNTLNSVNNNPTNNNSNYSADHIDNLPM